MGFILIGISRIISGVHYPLDIISGWVLGLLISTVLSLIYNLITKKRELSAVDKN
jgi:membrane-associated phospholipid phosphatase